MSLEGHSRRDPHPGRNLSPHFHGPEPWPRNSTSPWWASPGTGALISTSTPGAATAAKFIDFVASPQGQQIIRDYGRERCGEGLYNDAAFAKQYDDESKGAPGLTRISLPGGDSQA